MVPRQDTVVINYQVAGIVHDPQNLLAVPIEREIVQKLLLQAERKVRLPSPIVYRGAWCYWDGESNDKLRGVGAQLQAKITSEMNDLAKYVAQAKHKMEIERAEDRAELRSFLPDDVAVALDQRAFRI